VALKGGPGVPNNTPNSFIMNYDKKKLALRKKICKEIEVLRKKLETVNMELSKSVIISEGEKITNNDLVPFLTGINGGSKMKFIHEFHCETDSYVSIMAISTNSRKIGFLVYERGGHYKIHLKPSKGFEGIVKKHPRYRDGDIVFGVACTCCAFPDHNELMRLCKKHKITTLVVRKAQPLRDFMGPFNIKVEEISGYEVPRELKRVIQQIEYVNN
jgi:hypothetical protein